MKILRTLVAMSTLASLGFTLAVPARAELPLFGYEPRSRAEIEDELIKMARNHTHTFSRDVYTFHYLRRDPKDTSYRPPNSEWATNYINLNIHNSLWNPKVPVIRMEYADWYGQGIYAAADPIVSSNYASPDGGMKERSNTHPHWNMVQIKLSKGSRYWDISPHAPFSRTLRKDLKKGFGCNAETLTDLLRVNEAMDGKCRVFAKKILSELQIDAVGYPWAAYPSFKKFMCPAARPLAFYLTSKKPFRQDQIRHFTNTLPPAGTKDEASDNRIWIEEIFKLSRQPVASRRWPSLDNQKPTVPTRTWVKNHLFSCGNFIEDRKDPTAPELQVPVGPAGVGPTLVPILTAPPVAPAPEPAPTVAPFQVPEFEPMDMPELRQYEVPAAPAMVPFEVPEHEPTDMPELRQYEVPAAPAVVPFEVPEHEPVDMPELRQYEVPAAPAVVPFEVPEHEPTDMPELRQYEVPDAS